MWIRVFLTAFALAAVLYVQFAFNIKDWVKSAAAKTPDTYESGSKF